MLLIEELPVQVNTTDKINQLKGKINWLEEKSAELEASIRYAGLLQQAMLPSPERFKEVFDDAFVFFQPKDIVGGDFYWIYKHLNQVYFAVGDCTGHGVPGAMINMAGNTLLRNIIKIEGLNTPSDIVRVLDEEIIDLFNSNLSTGIARDGMDLAFCRFDLDAKKGYFCGAGRPLILVRNNDIVEFASGIDAIGYADGIEKSFKTVSFDLQEGDNFYLFSDGYTDQFGGEKVKKFNRKRFRTLLGSLRDMTMSEQEKELSIFFNNWKGKNEQIDDVCVVGVRI